MKISTAGGQIYGITQDSLDIFLGIPYAEPPINNHRFKHSTLKTQWNEPIDATTIKPIPPQPENKLEDFSPLKQQTLLKMKIVYILIFGSNIMTKLISQSSFIFMAEVLKMVMVLLNSIDQRI